MKYMNREREVLCSDSRFYLVPINLLIKVVPNLNDGIKIVGFLKELHENFVPKIVGNEEENVMYIFVNMNK